MGGLVPFFFNGGNAKIKVNGVTLAFCTDFSYSVEVAHQPTHIIGMYESTSIEPLSYKVSGQFSVVRYMNAVANDLQAVGFGTPNSVANSGNGIGAWSPNNSGTVLGTLLNSGAVGNDGRVQESFDPSKLQNATFFDVEVYQKMPATVTDPRGVAHIRSCRIIRADFGIVKRGVAQQRFTFEALYLDEDSFLASFSGLGQQFS